MSVQALLLAIGLLFFGAAVRAWTEKKPFRNASIWISICCVALAFGWRLVVKLAGSEFAARAAGVASSPWAWLVVFLCGWGYWATVSIILLRQRDRFGEMAEKYQTLVKEEIIPFRIALQRFVMPRRLSREEKKLISDYLKEYEPHSVKFVVARDTEAAGFGADIRGALSDGGWIVSPPVIDNTIDQGIGLRFSPSPEGTKRRDELRFPRPDRVLQEALSRGGVEFETTGSGGGQPEELTISIGLRRRDVYARPAPWFPPESR